MEAGHRMKVMGLSVSIAAMGTEKRVGRNEGCGGPTLPRPGSVDMEH